MTSNRRHPHTPVKLTDLIINRAVSLIGLLDIRAINLTDLEHSTHYQKTKLSEIIILDRKLKSCCIDFPNINYKFI